VTEIAGLLMAAGAARRMGGPNKLWLHSQGRPLVSFSVEALKQAKLCARYIVTGRDHEATGGFGKSHGFIPVHNPKFETGFGGSLAAGFAALLEAPFCDGALVMLADMPLVTSAHINIMMDAFCAAENAVIIRAQGGGVPGNPVIIPRGLFSQMAALTGDQSGQTILKASGIQVRHVEIGMAACTDIDTPEALAQLEGALL
jgi:molybdenum cofactor cytidylyltransferase